MTKKPPREFDVLMDRICVGLGFCGGVVDGESTHVTDFIPDKGVVTADQFVEFVLRGDGIDPERHELSLHLLRQIKQAFVDCMGGSTANASELRWKFD